MPDLTARGKALGPARRAYPVRIEVRAANPDGTIPVVGYASVTEAPYPMWDYYGEYSEVITLGAFAKTLAEAPKVQFLANHTGLSLAATTAGSLRLSEDATGLHVEADLNPKRSDAGDLLAAIADGAVDEMSFAFRVLRQQWSPDYLERRIDEVSLDRGDVSVVNLGANPATSVALRAYRTRGAARLAAIAAELREGKTLSSSTLDTLTEVLDLIAAADDAVDAAQPLLAELMGVPNPDEDDEDAGGAQPDDPDAPPATPVEQDSARPPGQRRGLRLAQALLEHTA